ncbi:MAG TPA: response regulator, partial [Proteobacteria bacterium]|nr:response regulator [Pseudomonadota bacterium]
MSPSRLHPGGKPVILIVDDDEFYRTTLSDAFQKDGYKTFTAPDGNEGFEIYREVSPDVVILDRIMPQAGGTRFLMSVKDLSNSKECLLVIYSSTIKEG